MYNSVETIHRRILEKINSIEAVSKPMSVRDEYCADFAHILATYYAKSGGEENATDAYYRMLISENYVDRINTELHKLKKLHKRNTPLQKIQPLVSNQLYDMEKQTFDYCCGERMCLSAEQSMLQCEICSSTYRLIGATFVEPPDTMFKPKPSGHETNKHLRFWIERIQGIENKTISDVDYRKIEYVIKSRSYTKSDIVYSKMRAVLKDPLVSLSTTLNDHIPKLIIMFGGVAPPLLDYNENMMVSLWFNKLIELYMIVKPGNGNKPYYPYFIYKILEQIFPHGHPKRRILEYIHLQNRDTVIKNDTILKEMYSIADPRDGFIYIPTDPS